MENFKHKIKISSVSSLIIVSLVSVLLLAACGANSGPNSDHDFSPAEDLPGNSHLPQLTQAAPPNLEEKRDLVGSTASEENLASGDAGLLVNLSGPEGRMIAYSYALSIETQDYATDFHKLDQAVRKLGGYFDSSDVSIRRAYEKDLHSAYFRVKIPQEKAQDFLAEVTRGVGTLISQSSSSLDYTDQYSDTEIRLESERKKLEAYNRLYEKAESMEDIMAIQSQIIDCQTRIDQLESSKKQIEGLTNYATFDIQLEEVFVVSEAERQDPSFGSRLGVAFADSLTNISDFFQDLLVFLALAWPFILLLVFIVWLLVRVRRRLKHKRGQRHKTDKAAAVALPEDKNTVEKTPSASPEDKVTD